MPERMGRRNIVPSTVMHTARNTAPVQNMKRNQNIELPNMVAKKKRLTNTLLVAWNILHMAERNHMRAE